MEFTYSGSVVYLLYDFAVDSGDSLGAFTHSTRGHSLLLLFQLSSYERESETYYKSYDKPFTPGFTSPRQTTTYTNSLFTVNKVMALDHYLGLGQELNLKQNH